MNEDDLFDDNGRLPNAVIKDERQVWELVRDWAPKCKGTEIPYDEPAFYSATLLLDKVYHDGPPELRIRMRDWVGWLTDEELAEFSREHLDPLLDAVAELAERKLKAL